MTIAEPERPSPAWDLVVVGGGPAGMSAALVASLNGLRVLLLERSDRLGGQVRWADAPIPDLLGGEAATGDALADRFAAHLAGTRASVRLESEVREVLGTENGLQLHLESGEILSAFRGLLATGVRHREIGVSGVELANRVASPRKALQAFRGQRVAIVGGGDEAASLAQDLGESGAAVVLLVRSALRARPRYAEVIRALDAVEIREATVVAALAPSETKSETGDCRIDVSLTGGDSITVDECFVRIGVETALPRIDPKPRRLEDGRVAVDAQLRTSCDSLFAAGDLVRPPAERYIAAALADGAVVARRVETDLATRG